MLKKKKGKNITFKSYLDQLEVGSGLKNHLKSSLKQKAQKNNNKNHTCRVTSNMEASGGKNSTNATFYCILLSSGRHEMARKKHLTQLIQKPVNPRYTLGKVNRDMSLSKLGSWWWTGKPGVLQSMGLQRVRHDWVSERNWPDLVQYLA